MGGNVDWNLGYPLCGGVLMRYGIILFVNVKMTVPNYNPTHGRRDAFENEFGYKVRSGDRRFVLYQNKRRWLLVSRGEVVCQQFVDTHTGGHSCAFSVSLQQNWRQSCS